MVVHSLVINPMLAVICFRRTTACSSRHPASATLMRRSTTRRIPVRAKLAPTPCQPTHPRRSKNAACVLTTSTFWCCPLATSPPPCCPPSASVRGVSTTRPMAAKPAPQRSPCSNLMAVFKDCGNTSRRELRSTPVAHA